MVALSQKYYFVKDNRGLVIKCVNIAYRPKQAGENRGERSPSMGNSVHESPMLEKTMRWLKKVM